MRNHKDPISQERNSISLRKTPSNRSGRSPARAYGAVAQVGGDMVTLLERAPLFLVICVTKVLIDDSRDVFPTLP